VGASQLTTTLRSSTAPFSRTVKKLNSQQLENKSTAETRLKLVAFALLLSEFVRSLGYNLYSISLPLIAQELAQSAILTGLAVGIFGLVQSAAQIPLGRYSDSHGRRGILLISAVIYAVGALLVGFAQDIFQFILFRAIQASGAVMSVLQACLGDIFPPERRGKAMAWFSIVYAVGTIVSLPLGGVIAGLFGLRMPFYLCAVFSFVAALILILLLKETLPSKIQCIQSNVPPIVVNISIVTQRDNRIAGGTESDGNGLNPMKTIFLKTRGFMQICFIGMVISLTMGSFFAFAPSFLDSLGYSVLDMGLIFIPGIAIFFSGSFLSGMVSDRIGRRIPVIVGLSIAVPFAFLVLIAPPSIMVIVVILLLLGIAICQPPLSALVLDLVPKQMRGNAAGVYSTLTIFGMALGAFIAGFLVESYGVNSIFALSGVLVSISLILGLIYLPKGKPPRAGANPL
jgi:MFS family permease